MADVPGNCPACLRPFPRPGIFCDVYKHPSDAFRRWAMAQPRTAVCSHPCPLVCVNEHCGADVAPVSVAPALPHQCEFTCQGCGKKASGVYYNSGHGWAKPPSWFERSDDDGVQTACSRECIDVVSKKSGKTGVVFPI